MKKQHPGPGELSPSSSGEPSTLSSAASPRGARRVPARIVPAIVADHRRALRMCVDGLRDAVDSGRVGDWIALGLRNEVLADALQDGLSSAGLGHVRRFSWSCPHAPRCASSFNLGQVAPDSGSLRALVRSHAVRGVSFVALANDFAPSPAQLIRTLAPVLADDALLIVCRQSESRSPLEVLAELKQQDEVVVWPVAIFGPSWLALRLQKRSIADGAPRLLDSRLTRPRFRR